MAGRTDQSGVRASIPVLGEATALILKGLTVVLPDKIERGWLPTASARPPHKGETVSILCKHCPSPTGDAAGLVMPITSNLRVDRYQLVHPQTGS